ncbi:MAG: hypothetical protein E7Z91_06255 [Cyanobacteria bacterium SIG30]|nr:hypothetical protein [Cyanobacteria bacterium SIG30]
MAIQTTEFRHFVIDNELKQTLDAFDQANIRTSFKQASDPIYLAFKYVDNKPLSRLAYEFVEDSANDFIQFISKLFS